VVHDISQDHDDNPLQQRLLWQSGGEPLANVIAKRNAFEVDTGLACKTVANALMRIKLVDAKTNTVLCSAFFNPTSMITNGPTSFGSDMRLAWHTYRSLQYQPG